MGGLNLNPYIWTQKKSTGVIPLENLFGLRIITGGSFFYTSIKDMHMGRQVGKSLMFTQASMPPPHITHLRALEHGLCSVHQRISILFGFFGHFVSVESGLGIIHSCVDAQ